jgi:hypothetical protein
MTILRIKMSRHLVHKPLEFSQSFRLILLIPLKGYKAEEGHHGTERESA